jgi:hypothetical protein
MLVRGRYRAASIGGSSPPTFELVGAAQSSSSGITVPWQASHAANDLGIIPFMCRGDGSFTLPSGWGLIGSQLVGGDNNLRQLHAMWKRAVSGAEAAQAIADTGARDFGYMFGVRGALASGDPIDAMVLTRQDTTNTSFTLNGLSTLGPNRLVIDLLCNRTIVATPEASGWTNADLTGFAERADLQTSAGSGGGISVASGVKAAAGPVGVTTGFLATSSPYVGIKFAVKPA